MPIIPSINVLTRAVQPLSGEGGIRVSRGFDVIREPIGRRCRAAEVGYDSGKEVRGWVKR